MVCFMQKKRDSRNNNSRMKKKRGIIYRCLLFNQTTHTARAHTPSSLCCYTHEAGAHPYYIFV